MDILFWNVSTLDPFFIWLEATAPSTWVRESPSVFAFPTVLSLHALGMGLVAGLNAIIAMRILGVARQVPFKEIKRFLPVMWFGFWLNAVSGVALLIAYPTKALTNPVFYLKLLFIALAVIAAGKAALSESKPWARISLASWTAAIVAGRLLAYTYSRLMATGPA
jgi:hypothetical protein